MKYLSAIALSASLFSQPVLSETVSFDPNQIAGLDIKVGDTFQIDVVGTEFTSGTDGGGINFGFDPGIVQVDDLVL